MDRRTLLKLGAIAPVTAYLPKEAHTVLLPTDLEEGLHRQAVAFHGTTPPGEQLRDTRALLDRAQQAHGKPQDRALVPRAHALMSAIAYKAGDAGAATAWADHAITSADRINDSTAKAHGYIRRIQVECWYGSSGKAQILSTAGIRECWSRVPAMEAAWLASHAMRAYAMNGDLVGYRAARQMAEDKLRKVNPVNEMTAFTFREQQFPQAVAVATTYIRPDDALKWYDTALEMNPESAIHVTTLDRLHRAMAMVRSGDKEGGLDFAIASIHVRAQAGPLDNVYKDRAKRVLGSLAKGYQTERTRYLRHLVGARQVV
ncbi:hypothetical protein E1298_01885 [Actinomadura rubrisoli]|uniref:Uncharacterized protein n=2 Tax=Actinomadura rubrisoli TaxID=2530368 RepID=A0A4R5CIL9_9ACTN|nr:hypothetical protein E1298_01885 [Actinomadura rubrisoli]